MADINAQDLRIDIAAGKERDIFKWFIASFLFGKRIQQDIAAKTYEAIIEKHRLDTPKKLCERTWQELVDILGEGHYVRYDESTADRLLKLCEKLNAEYDGKVSAIYKASESREDFEKRLTEFKGIGPKTVEIFMREVGPLWYP